MSSTTVTCTRDTYIDRSNPNTSYYNAQNLKTITGNMSNIYNINYEPLLQFSIDTSLKYKRITRVSLNYYIGKNVNCFISGVWYTPYLINNTNTDITYSNVSTAGTIGSSNFVPKNIDFYTLSGTWISEDITDIYINNVTNNIFSVFIGTGLATSGNNDCYISSMESSNAPYLTIEYETVDQLSPTITYPRDVYIRQGTDIRFSWIFNSSTAATQSSVSIEWKKPSDQNYTVIPVTTTQQSYLLSGELPTGTINWRMKVVNDANESSDYVYANFVIVGKPSIPVINTITNKTLTSIEWNANDQCCYDISITKDEEQIISETVNTQNTTYKPQIFLDNGTYNVSIRVKNTIDLWSDYTNKSFVINTISPDKPIINLRQINNKIMIDCNYVTDKAVLYRQEGHGKFIPIKMLRGETEYCDYQIKNEVEYKYFLRSFNDGYNDSDIKSGYITFNGFILDTDSTQVNICSSTEEYLQFAENIKNNKNIFNCCGRHNPIFEVSEFTTRTISRSGYVNKVQLEQIKNMYSSNNNIIYRDNRNNCFDCCITSISFSNYKTDGYIVSMDIVEVDKNEVAINE